MTQSKFQETVLRKLSQYDEFQETVLKQLGELSAFVKRQEDFNAVVAGQFERIDQRLSDQQVLIENEIIERSKMLGEGNRMYTDTKVAEHEVAFH